MKIKNYLIIGLSLLPLLSTPAMADRAPKAGQADARVKTLTYHENDVYRLKGHYGFTTVIEFSPKEKIETISVGDSESWQIIKPNRNNILFIKPLEHNAETNMTVLTSKRIYTFELAAGKAPSPKSSELTFRVKFRYPEEASMELANIGSMPGGKYDPLEGSDTTDWNFDYSYSGDKSLRPKRVFDDGTFTYFEFTKPDATPAIFSVDADGNESIVNFNMQGSYMVVNSTKRQFTLRDGDTATCIFNGSYPKVTGKQTAMVPIEEMQEKKTKKAQGTKVAEKTEVSSTKQASDSLAESEEPSFFSYLRGNTATTLNN